MKKVILYSRVSTEQQVINGHSIETQINNLKNYAELKGYTNTVILTDEGLSGKNTNRSSFIKMMEMVKKNEVEAIIVYSLGRFARSVVDTIKAIDILNKHSVSFHSLTENIDTSTAIGRFFTTILASLAQLVT